jgi:hypothetical protein
MFLKKVSLQFTRVVAVTCAILLVPGDVILLAQDAPPQNQAPLLPPDQLDSLAAPVALYPDPLLSQILVAATYPLELVQASQWIQQNPGLTGAALTQAAAQQNWDPSVQALVVFPDLMKRLTQDITWTTNLGNAFLAQQGDVMDAVQRLRVRAQEAGKLASTPQQQVITSNDGGRPIIEIQPASPEVIYVPQYDPAYIWGPPVFFPYPHWYYPRPGIALVGGGFFGFGVGISMGVYFGGGWGGWGGWGWHPGWGNHTVIVNNTFIHRNNFNTTNITNVHGSSAWSHDSFHRQGVPYPNRSVSQQYGGGVRSNLAPRNNAGPQGGFRNSPPANNGFRGNSAPNPGNSGFRGNPSPNPGNPGNSGFRGNSSPSPNPGNSGFRGNSSPSPNPGNSGFRNNSPAPSSPSGDRFGNRQIAPSTPSSANRSAFGGIEHGSSATVHSDHGYSSLGPARSAAPPSGGGGRFSGGGNSGGGGRSSGGGNSGGGGGRRR